MSEAAPLQVDIAVVGGGPAGLTAGLYAVRTGRPVVLLEKLAPGGQAATTWQVDNYPGLPHANGAELMMKMEAQVRELGLPIVSGAVTSIFTGPPHRLVIEGQDIMARTVILATGAKPRKLNIPGEDEYRGHGVSYCATCDGAFFRNQPVAVIGGGNAALEEADFLTRFASRVFILHRRDHFRADKIVQDLVTGNPKIEILRSVVATEIIGQHDGVKGLLIGTRSEPECRELPVKGVFIFAGLEPETESFRGLVELDSDGYIKTDENFMTSIPGIFAAGDCRVNLAKQIVVAAGEGAAAAMVADRYLQHATQTL